MESAAAAAAEVAVEESLAAQPQEEGQAEETVTTQEVRLIFQLSLLKFPHLTCHK